MNLARVPREAPPVGALTASLIFFRMQIEAYTVVLLRRASIAIWRFAEARRPARPLPAPPAGAGFYRRSTIVLELPARPPPGRAVHWLLAVRRGLRLVRANIEGTPARMRERDLLRLQRKYKPALDDLARKLGTPGMRTRDVQSLLMARMASLGVESTVLLERMTERRKKQ